MSELVFEVEQEADGGFCARAIGASIFTQGDTWGELRRWFSTQPKATSPGPKFPNKFDSISSGTKS